MTSSDKTTSVQSMCISKRFTSKFGDLALRSLDNTIFYFPRTLLEFSSEVFAVMLKSASRRDNETLDIQADSESLDVVLSCIHPGMPKPTIKTVATLAKIIGVATNYQMKLVIITLRSYFVVPPATSENLVSQPLVQKEPLASLVVAQSFKFDEIVDAALLELIKTDLGAQMQIANTYEVPLGLMARAYQLRELRVTWYREKIVSLSQRAVTSGSRGTVFWRWQSEALTAISVQPNILTLKAQYTSAVERNILQANDTWRDMSNWEKEAGEMESKLPDMESKLPELKQRSIWEDLQWYQVAPPSFNRHRQWHFEASFSKAYIKTCCIGMAAQDTFLIHLSISETFNERFGDFALQSSDNVLFYIPRVMLQYSSNIFATMLEVGSEHSMNTIPIAIQGHSRILDLIFTFIHPGLPNPTISDIATLVDLFRVATQYEMNGVLDSLRLCFFVTPNILEDGEASSLIIKEPLASLAVAISFECNDVARIALREVLKSDISTQLGHARRFELPLSLVQRIHVLRQERVNWFRDTVLEIVAQVTIESPQDRTRLAVTFEWQGKTLDAIQTRPIHIVWMEQCSIALERSVMTFKYWKSMKDAWETEISNLDSQLPDLGLL